MTTMRLVERAVSMFGANRYLTMATCSNDQCWAAPLNYVIGPGPYLHYYSAVESRHSRDVSENRRVVCAIFDSTAVSDDVDGMQFVATCTEVGESEVAAVAEHYFEKNFPDPAVRESWYRPPWEFVADGPWRFYRIDPTEIYVIDFESVVNTKIDRRCDVPLDDVKRELDRLGS